MTAMTTTMTMTTINPAWRAPESIDAPPVPAYTGWAARFFNEGNVLRVEYTPIIMTKGGGFTFDWCLLSERSTNENPMMKTLKSGFT